MPFINEKMKINENKYYNECIEEIYLPLKISDNNDKEKRNINILFNSCDKVYKIKGKNKSGFLDEGDNRYKSYNFKKILNCIDDRLQNLKKVKIKNSNLALYKYNSISGLQTKEYNIFCINRNPNIDSKIFNRDIRMINTFEDNNNGINSIQICGNGGSKRGYSGDTLLRIF